MEQALKAAVPTASAVAIILFALPSYIGTLRQKGLGRGVLILLSLSLFTLAVEAIAVKTHLPYGQFSYGSSVGYRLLNLVPWPIAFTYTPLLLGAFWLANKITGKVWRILLTALFVVAANLVLAPALVRMSIWQWQDNGVLYGIPAMALAGWFLVSLVGAYILSLLWGDTPVRRSAAFSLFCIVWFWAGVNLGLEQWVPGAIGVGIGFLLLISMFFERRAEQRSEKRKST